VDRVLDVSDLPAPEPLERTLDALCKLSQGDRLLLRHRRQPFPLYDMLRRMGYRWQVTGEDGDWRILIEPFSVSSAADSDHSP
jgi:uncharacterized protein (DUF2249 family)